MNLHTGWKSSLALAFSLSAGLAVSFATSARAQAPAFTDVPADYWANSYIESLAEQGIVSGFPDGSFRPDAPVTRAQFAAILRQTFAGTEDSPAQPFDDVPANYWAAEAIAAARSANFLSGYPGNVFNPEQSIPRVQTLVSLTSGLGYTDSETSDYSYYTDASDIPDYAQASITAATQRRLVVNYPLLTSLNPNRNATRAEVVASVYQALAQEGRVTPLPASPYLVETSASAWSSEPATTLPVRAERIDLSQDGRRLVALLAQENSELKSRLEVWDTQTGEPVISMTSNESTRFEAVAISDDGLKIAAITQTQPSYELNLLVWDLPAGVPPTNEPLGSIRLLTSNAPPEVTLGFASTSAQVAFGANDTMIMSQVKVGIDSPSVPGESLLRLHEGATGEVLRTLTPTPGAQLVQFDFSPDGTLLAGRGRVVLNRPAEANDILGSVIDVWQLESGELSSTLRPEESIFSFSAMAFTPTGAFRTLAIGEPYEESLNVWNLPAAVRIEHTVDLPEVDRQDYTHLLSPDGIYYFMRGDVAGTRLLNTHTLEVTPLNTLVRQAVFSATGDHLAIATPENISIFSQVEAE
ncbi:MAG: S-layer homology domain-containing protein [Phormidesmis sp.]